MFRKQGFLELEALLSLEEAKVLKTLLDDSLASHLGIMPEKISSITLQKRFLSGYELQLDNLPLKKALKLSKLGQIGADLFHQHALCLGFTQYYPCLPTPVCLKDISSLSEVCGGAFIGLSSSELPMTPQNSGNVLFFKPDLILPFPQFDFPLLLLAFTTDKARYIRQPSDPHTHFLKKLGLAFGDKVTSETHPQIFRK